MYQQIPQIPFRLEFPRDGEQQKIWIAMGIIITIFFWIISGLIYIHSHNGGIVMFCFSSIITCAMIASIIMILARIQKERQQAQQEIFNDLEKGQNEILNDSSLDDDVVDDVVEYREI